MKIKLKNINRDIFIYKYINDKFKYKQRTQQ